MIEVHLSEFENAEIHGMPRRRLENRYSGPVRSIYDQMAVYNGETAGCVSKRFISRSLTHGNRASVEARRISRHHLCHILRFGSSSNSMSFFGENNIIFNDQI